MAGRVLISTFGFDERKVLRAFRAVPHETLGLVLSSESQRSPGYRRLRDLLAPPREFLVRPFDFLECFRTTCRAIDSFGGSDVTVNVSGGTKIMADAAVLASFACGASAVHAGDEVVRLPLLRGVRLEEAFSRDDRAVLRSVRRSVRVEALVSSLVREGVAESRARGSIRRLHGLGILDLRIRKGKAYAAWAPEATAFRIALVGDRP